LHTQTNSHISEDTLKKTLLTLLLAAVMPISLAAPAPKTGRLSGSQIIERWTSPSSDGSDRSPSQILAREYVDGYLAGVADATEGTVWCNTHFIKPHELDAEVIGLLKDIALYTTPHPSAKTVYFQ
jgi:hypothetical protein